MGRHSHKLTHMFFLEKPFPNDFIALPGIMTFTRRLKNSFWPCVSRCRQCWAFPISMFWIHKKSRSYSLGFSVILVKSSVVSKGVIGIVVYLHVRPRPNTHSRSKSKRKAKGMAKTQSRCFLVAVNWGVTKDISACANAKDRFHPTRKGWKKHAWHFFLKFTNKCLIYVNGAWFWMFALDSM